MKLTFTNSLSRKKEAFNPLVNNQVSLYVCGVTPYDDSHIGHARCYVTFDILVRLLKFLHYNVTYVRNYTDIDDKLLHKADQTTGDEQNYLSIATHFIDRYQKNMQQLNCLTPNIEPRVTDHIPEIIDFVEKLVTKGHAYVVDNDVYYDICTFKKYGALSGKKLNELQAGSRVAIDERKKNPEDFALWKGTPENTFWKSPWGYGRPAWHIECSVLSRKYLGDTIDIHAGGMDLMFPHHENEIAQTEGLTDKQFAQYWLHNAFVTINKEKMSKSLKNFVTLNEIFESVDPMVLRYFILQHHYRTPMEFSFEDLESVKVAYKKLITALSTHQVPPPQPYASYIKGFDLAEEMLAALADDLNTPKLLGVIFAHLDVIKESEDLILATRIVVQDILGLTLEPLAEKEITITSEIQNLIDAREQARTNKDWATADKIRDQLKALGIDLQDKKR